MDIEPFRLQSNKYSISVSGGPPGASWQRPEGLQIKIVVPIILFYEVGVSFAAKTGPKAAPETRRSPRGAVSNLSWSKNPAPHPQNKDTTTHPKYWIRYRGGDPRHKIVGSVLWRPPCPIFGNVWAFAGSGPSPGAEPSIFKGFRRVPCRICKTRFQQLDL